MGTGKDHNFDMFDMCFRSGELTVFSRFEWCFAGVSHPHYFQFPVNARQCKSHPFLTQAFQALRGSVSPVTTGHRMLDAVWNVNLAGGKHFTRLSFHMMNSFGSSKSLSGVLVN